MRSDDFDLPAASVRAIGKLLGVEGVDYLLPMLQHHAAKIREAAIIALDMNCSSDPRVAPEVATLLYDPHPNIRQRVLTYFNHHPYPRKKFVLLTMLNDPLQPIRVLTIVALRSLGGLHDPEIGTALREMLLTEPEGYVRGTIIYQMSETFTPNDIPLLEAVIEQRISEIGTVSDHLCNMTASLIRKLQWENEPVPYELMLAG
jgi:HEAT repeat protein